MIVKTNKENGRRISRLFFLITAIFLVTAPAALAHPSPNSLVILDVNPAFVRMEVQMPVPELELAFGQPLADDVIIRRGQQIEDYLLAHIKAYSTPGRLWRVEIDGLEMTKGLYADQVTAYREVVANVKLYPRENESTRSFYLAYDVILHEVINHVALVSVRSDWEKGNFGEDHSLEKASGNEAYVVGWDLAENRIPPLHINLEEGSWWTGFKAMVKLGMHHISEGTDHLMFLLVLLLPAPLLAERKGWGDFKGLRPSLYTLLKIVTAFTIGHSITLLTGALGGYRVPSQPVEVLIAFSIFISALHAFRPLFPGRETYVAAGFGLIHGMAFATTLSGLQLSTGAMALSILGFNAGIEIMQLFIVLLVMPWLILMSRSPAYPWFRRIMAILTAVAALAWMAERAFNRENKVTAHLEILAEKGEWFIILTAFLAIFMYIAARLSGRKPE